MKHYLIIIVIILFTSPLVSQAAFRWPWQVKPATHQTKPTEVKKLAPIDTEVLKQGTAKMRKWERLAESPYVKGKENLSVEFTEAELESIVRDAVSKMKDAPLSADDFKVKLINGKVMVLTTVLKPVRFGAQVILSAVVKNDKLEPKIESAKAGVFPVSGHIIERLANQVFGARWRTELNRPQFVWDEIKIGEGKVVVRGHVIKKLKVKK